MVFAPQNPEESRTVTGGLSLPAWLFSRGGDLLTGLAETTVDIPYKLVAARFFEFSVPSTTDYQISINKSSVGTNKTPILNM